MSTSLLIDASQVHRLAPMQMHLKTGDSGSFNCNRSTSVDDHRLDELTPTMNECSLGSLSRKVVHVIDREADTLGADASVGTNKVICFWCVAMIAECNGTAKVF